MAFIAITAPSVGDPTRLDTFASPVVNNLLYLYGAIPSPSTALLANGSFEANTVTNAAPAGWTLTTLATSNTCQTETSAANTRHGKQAFSMTTPGGITGGCVITSSLGICSESEAFFLRWLMKSSVATITNSVSISFYDQAGTFISTTTVWSASSGNATSWQPFMSPINPPAGARQFAVILTGVNSTTAGTVYWDGVECDAIARGVRTAVFTATGNFIPPSDTDNIEADILAAGGGGGGGGGMYTSGVGANGSAGGVGGDSWVGVSTNKARGGLGGNFGGGNNTTTPGSAGAAVAYTFVSSVTAGLIQFGSMALAGTAGVVGVTNGGAGGLGGAVKVAGNFAWLFGPLSGGAPGAGVGGSGGNPAASTAGVANTGFGGAGGTGGGSSGTQGSGGGGSAGLNGEYARLTLAVTSGAPITVTVGTGGAVGNGGTGGASIGGNGAKGSDGLVLIHY